MGVSVSASMHLGFPVTHDDFWQLTEHEGALACPNGHTDGAAEGKFCRECGGQFARRTGTTAAPSEGLRALAEELGTEPHELVDPDPDVWPEAEIDGLGIFCCDGYGDADTEEEDYAFGKGLACTGDISHMEGGESIALSDMRVFLARVEHIRDRLGLKDREIHLYLCSTCSY